MLVLFVVVVVGGCDDVSGRVCGVWNSRSALVVS